LRRTLSSKKANTRRYLFQNRKSTVTRTPSEVQKYTPLSTINTVNKNLPRNKFDTIIIIIMDGYIVEIFTHPLVLNAGLFCLAAQGILHVLFAFVFPKGPWTEVPSFTAHQLVCLTLMIYVSYSGFVTWFFTPAPEGKFMDAESRLFDLSEGGRDVGHVIFGMLIFWDIPVGFLTPALHDTLMAIHHIAIMCRVLWSDCFRMDTRLAVIMRLFSLG
jgi:hypothetical protein